MDSQSRRTNFGAHPTILLAGILATGIALRLWHLGWGLPELLEEAVPLRISWNIWNWGMTGFDFNPHTFTYSSLTSYINFLAQAIAYGIGHLFGVYSDLVAFKSAFESDPSTLVLLSRLVSVVFDAGTILLSYMLAKRLSNERIGLLAALLVAVNPLHIRESHLINVDTPLTFFVITSILLLVSIHEKPSPRSYILAGVTIGLAASSKYNGALLLVVLLFVHLLRQRTASTALQALRDVRLWKAIVASGAVFLLINPYVALDFPTFLRDFTAARGHMESGHLGVDSQTSSIEYYWLQSLPANLGWILTAIIVGTILHMIVAHRKQDLIALAFPAAYIAAIGSWEMRADRYIYPIVPLLIVIGCVGCFRLWNRVEAAKIFQLPASKGHRLRIAGGIAAAGILVAQPLLRSYEYLHPLGLPDTRILSKHWISEHLPAGSSLASGPYGVDFPTNDSYRIVHIPFLSYETERAVPFYDTRWYEDVDFLLASDYDYGRYAGEPERYKDFLPYYDSLHTRWKLVQEWKPSSEQAGPTLWLYTYPDSLRRPRFDQSLFERLHDEPESLRVSRFLNELVGVLLAGNRFEKCAQVLEELVSVEVDNLPARNLLAQLQLTLGRSDQALRQMQVSLKINANQSKVFEMAGRALLTINRTIEAERSFWKAIDLDQQYATPYEDLIKLYTSQHDKRKLEETLRRYAQILPDESQRRKEIKKQLEDSSGGK